MTWLVRMRHLGLDLGLANVLGVKWNWDGIEDGCKDRRIDGCMLGRDEGSLLGGGTVGFRLVVGSDDGVWVGRKVIVRSGEKFTPSQLAKPKPPITNSKLSISTQIQCRWLRFGHCG